MAFQAVQLRSLSKTACHEPEKILVVLTNTSAATIARLAEHYSTCMIKREIRLHKRKSRRSNA